MGQTLIAEVPSISKLLQVSVTNNTFSCHVFQMESEAYES